MSLITVVLAPTRRRAAPSNLPHSRSCAAINLRAVAQGGGEARLRPQEASMDAAKRTRHAAPRGIVRCLFARRGAGAAGVRGVTGRGRFCDCAHQLDIREKKMSRV
jgi:hypothetical protein